MLRPLLLAFAFVSVSFAQPDTAWLFTYPASEHGESQPLAAFFDDTGNVYIAGWSQNNPERPDVLLLKIDSLGQLVWDRTYLDVTAVGAARDTAGNIYITGSSTDASEGWLYTLNYSPNGDLVWAKNYTEPHRRFRSLGSIAIDDSQNVYVCGSAESASCGIVRLLKYRPNGVLANVMSYTLSRTMSLWWGDFHILNDGAAYLVTTIARRPGDWPCHRLIVKLSSQGRVLWQRIYRDTDSTFEYAQSSQVDENANIYITGQATRPDGFCTMEMDSSGKVTWAREYPYSGGAVGFLMLHNGSVYVASGLDTLKLVKYDSLGDELWLSKYGNGGFMLVYVEGYGEEQSPDFCPMNVDDSGNVYLTGQDDTTYSTGKGRRDLGVFGILLKYDPQGKLMWTRTRPWTNERPDGGLDVTWSGAIVGFGKDGALYDIGLGGASAECGIYVLKYRAR